MARGKHEKKKVKLLDGVDWRTFIIGALFDLLVGFAITLIQHLFDT